MTLSVTFDDEAWEFFYDLIEKYAEKNLAVRLTLANGDTQECRLVRVGSDMYDTPVTDDDPMPFVAVNNDLLGDRGEVREWPISLYHKTSVGTAGYSHYECNIVGIHVL